MELRSTESAARDERHEAADWVRAQQARGRYTFTQAEAVVGTGRTLLGVSKALRRLVRQRRLVAPRQGFYVVVPAEYDLAGAPPVQWFIDDLMGFLGQPYYVGLLTAAAHHGAAHQAAQVFQVVTDRPTRAVAVGRHRLQFVSKANIGRTPVQAVKTPTGTMTVSTPEATALDLVRYYKIAGFLGHVATVLDELAERMGAEAVARAAVEGDFEMSVVQRLGYLLERVGAEAVTGGLAKLVTQAAPQPVPLRPDLSRKGHPLDARWRIVVNDEVESDLRFRPPTSTPGRSRPPGRTSPMSSRTSS
jgi:predicted transcriptional regulator of viral defense system